MKMEPAFLTTLIMPVMRETLSRHGCVGAYAAKIAPLPKMAVNLLTASAVQSEVAMMTLAACCGSSELLVIEVKCACS